MKILIVNDKVPAYIRFHSETVNAVDLPDGTFSVRNSSFLVRNLAYGDRVSASVSAESGLVFVKLVEAGGFSSFRAYSKHPGAEKLLYEACRATDQMGAGSSLLNDHRLALVTIPPGVDCLSVAVAFRESLKEVPLVFTWMALRHKATGSETKEAV